MQANKIKDLFEENWFKILTPFIESQQFDDIISHLKSEKANGKKVVPFDVDCFNAFKYCPYNELKVVIIGQDPYHGIRFDKPEAHGLAFSYKKTNQNDYYVPKSLQNILKEVAMDVYGSHSDLFIDQDTNLERWAKQGVLLLNTALTTIEGTPGAHLTLWKPFTNYVIQYLNTQNPGLIWMLWGSDARKYKIHLDCTRHHILEAGHPSPLNCNPITRFEGCEHFKKANELLVKMNGKLAEIQW